MMTWCMDDPQGNEAGKVKWDIVQYTRGQGIDVGCGPHKAFPHFVGVDSTKDTSLFGIAMTPDVVCQDACKLDCQTGSLDFVFSSHLLEHIEDTHAALTEWWRTLKPGGHLVLYLPHKDLYPNVGTPHANPDHKHDFTEQDIRVAMAKMVGGWDLLVEEVRDQGQEYSFLQVWRKRADAYQHITLRVKPKAKTACVVRYGGFGDSLQAANVLPELKRQGFHVTFMTTPKGQDMLKHDPHIDDWLLQDDDQVPNHELVDYWAVMAKRFDRFINLCESVEGTLLAYPGRANHMWPLSVRQKELGSKNYLEWTAQLAEVPYSSDLSFYASRDEFHTTRRYLADFKNSLAPAPLKLLQAAPPRFHILWCLSGSSMHKFYPHQDEVIAQVLRELPQATIIFSGDYPCKLLESGWEKHPRVKCESGEMGMRATLSLAQQVQCVVGPETGVLNAVAFEPVPKVIMLSHSSPENLTKHWLDTSVMQPANTPCWPCHRLHYGAEFCHEVPETGAALCQTNIDPALVMDAIRTYYRRWELVQKFNGETL